jgi:hypothetical protein
MPSFPAGIRLYKNMPSFPAENLYYLSNNFAILSAPANVEVLKMAVQTVENALKRISEASVFSPITVFVDDKKGRVRTVFANTFMTQLEKPNKGVGYIGTYSRGSNLRLARREILGSSIN